MAGSIGSPDVRITNAVIYTGDRSKPWARNMSIRSGRIVALDDDSLAQGAPAVDLGGRFVMPGFVDVHNHHAIAGQSQLFRLQFPATATLDQVLDAVRERTIGSAPDEWILGGNWGSNLVAELSTGDALRRLDIASGGRAVILEDDSRHNCWANTIALHRGGITEVTRNPAGGEIVRDRSSGRLTGLLLEAAAHLLAEAAPEAFRLSTEQHLQSSAHAIGTLHSFGITAFQDALTRTAALTALKTLDDHSRLDAWVVSSLLCNEPGSSEWVRSIGDAGQYRSPHHRPDFVKIYLDGVPTTRTAAFLEPYSPENEGDPPQLGELTLGVTELTGWLRTAASVGLSAKLHCAGDAAVRRALDAIEPIRRDGNADTRFHIAHGQFISPDDLPRFAQLDVTADISPFLWFPGVIPHAMRHVLPSSRVERMQPVRDLVDTGVLVAGGSDWPVTDEPNPLVGIQGLVTRADPSGRFGGTLWAEQALTVSEAISVFTRNGAEAMGLGNVTGTLTPGKSADFVVLDLNLLSINSSAIADTRVEETWFEGTAVYRAT